MASIFKRGRDRGRRNAAWYIAYVDEAGRRRMVRGCPAKAATEALARKLASEAELRRRGVIDPKADAYRRHEERRLVEHLGDFVADLRGRENTPRYVQQVRSNILRLVELAELRRLSDLSPSRVQAALTALRAAGLSLQTVNHYLRHIKGLSRWLWRDGRIREDTLAHLAAFNVATDRRHDRRALSEDEVGALIRAADEGPDVLGMSGPDRALLYRVALGTGFRASELRSLAPESFRLDEAPPLVVVAAAYSKHRRDDLQPIRPELATALKQWLAGKPADRTVFALPEKAARMLRVDLAAAGILYRDASGQVGDFHSLRHTFVSMLARSNAPVKVVQSLARHSSPVLTLGRYAHVGLQDQAGALEALPDMTAVPLTDRAAKSTTTEIKNELQHQFICRD